MEPDGANEEPGFNLFLLIMCLISLPFYFVGAAVVALMEGGQNPIPTFRPPRRSYIPPAQASACPCCGSWQINKWN